MQEMLPVLKRLWQGDYEHKGTLVVVPALDLGAEAAAEAASAAVGGGARPGQLRLGHRQRLQHHVVDAGAAILRS